MRMMKGEEMSTVNARPGARVRKRAPQRFAGPNGENRLRAANQRAANKSFAVGRLRLLPDPPLDELAGLSDIMLSLFNGVHEFLQESIEFFCELKSPTAVPRERRARRERVGRRFEETMLYVCAV